MINREEQHVQNRDVAKSTGKYGLPSSERRALQRSENPMRRSGFRRPQIYHLLQKPRLADRADWRLQGTEELNVELSIHNFTNASSLPSPQEAEEKHYAINDFDPEIVDRMLTFMYTGSYPDDVSGIDSAVVGPFAEVSAVNDTTKCLFLHLSMNCIGEYYQVAELRKVANRRIDAILQGEWSSIQKWFSTFVESAYCNGSDENLRKLVTSHAVKNAADLREDLPDFINLEIPREFFADVLCSHLGCKPRNT